MINGNVNAMTTAHMLITLATAGSHLVLRDRHRGTALAWTVAAGVFGPAAWLLRTAVVLAARHGDVDAAEGLALVLEQAGLPGELVDVVLVAAGWTRRRLGRGHAGCWSR